MVSGSVISATLHEDNQEYQLFERHGFAVTRTMTA